MDIVFDQHLMPGPGEYATYATESLRQRFLLRDLFLKNKFRLYLTDLDRAIVGGITPVRAMKLEPPGDLRADSFCERRELGVINIGEPGQIHVDGELFTINHRDCIYIGRGAREIVFSSVATDSPAQFYLLSYPAHSAFPTQKVTLQDANRVELGSDGESNRRTIYQFIHEGGVRSCQLVMGFTELHPGSCWNTMPCHTHQRRSEIYFYFNVAPEHQVLHQMGRPQETRGLWVGNQQAVLSPAWSIHCGVGTNSYSFIWGMGGENQRFDDMDGVPIAELR